jgi:hypothetical protein
MSLLPAPSPAQGLLAKHRRGRRLEHLLTGKYVLFSGMQRKDGVIRYRILKTQKEKTMKWILVHGTATLVHRTAALVIFLALVACAAPAPTAEQPTATQAVLQPTQTPVVIVETVVVTVIPTQASTEVPSATPLPPSTEVPATQPPAETAQLPAPAAADTSGGLIPVDDNLGAGWFVNMTRTRNDFALRCQLSKEITFSVKPTDPNITQVDFYYRIVDRATGAAFDWQNAGRMIPDANDNFVLVFSGESVNANFRKPNAWFDYQFIGSSGSGVVGRSEKIEQQVTYTFDCP